MHRRLLHRFGPNCWFEAIGPGPEPRTAWVTRQDNTLYNTETHYCDGAPCNGCEHLIEEENCKFIHCNNPLLFILCFTGVCPDLYDSPAASTQLHVSKGWTPRH